MTIKVLSTHAVMDVTVELGQQFERATGRKLSFSYDPANVLKRRIDGGEEFDVAIVTRQVLDDFAKRGTIMPDTRTDIGRSGLGVSVRKGARKPDIGTVEDFKRAMLAAKSVVRSKDGTSGIYFETLLDRLGIAEDMRGKIKLGPSGRVAELVAKGEADMVVQQISELLPVSGADFAGPFPDELQLYTVFSAGVGTASKNRDAAKALIGSFVTPAAVALFKAKGLEPVPLHVELGERQ
jgi:molybdate transport system substrate-binding protein